MHDDIKVGDKMIFISGFHKEVCGHSELVEILELRADNKYCFRKHSGGTDTTRAGHLRKIPEGLIVSQVDEFETNLLHKVIRESIN